MERSVSKISCSQEMERSVLDLGLKVSFGEAVTGWRRKDPSLGDDPSRPKEEKRIPETDLSVQPG